MKPILNKILFVIGLIFAIYILESWIYGIIIFIILIGLYKLYTKREAMKAGMENIESMVWGKPLDKDLWEKGEMKNTKIKFTMGGKSILSKKYWMYLGAAILLASGFIVILGVFR